MKKTLLFLSIGSIFTLFSCNKQSEKDITFFGGEIENPQSDSVFISIDGIKKGFALDEKGRFNDTIHLKEAAYFTFTDQNEYTNLYLSPKDSIYIKLNADDFDGSIVYTGKGAEKNNYLAKKMLVLSQQRAKNSELYEQEPVQFKNTITANQEELLTLLKSGNVGETFSEIETQNLAFDIAAKLLYYKDKASEDISVPMDFYKETENLDFDSEAFFKNYPNYKNLVNIKYKKELESSEPQKLDAFFQTIKSQSVKDNLLKMVYQKIKPDEGDPKVYFNLIEKYAQNAELKQKATDKLVLIEKLAKGKTSPQFSYQDINDKTVSLEQLKGKVVYIDVWATWCGPCLAEIPAMKKLEKEYKDKNIAFVAISVDKQSDFDKWKTMVNEKEMKGYQLFGGNDKKAGFAFEYGVEYIPRFILLDENGNILNAYAPKPSSDEIKTVLNDALNNKS